MKFCSRTFAKRFGIRGTSASTNYNTYQTMLVGRKSGDRCRSYVYFPSLATNTALSQASTIKSATLSLTESDASESGVVTQLKRVTSSWSRSSIKYNSQPSWNGDVLASTTSTGTKGTVRSINLLSYAKAIVAKQYSNYGMILLSSKESDTTFKKGAAFYTSRSTAASYRPKLVLTYVEKPTQATGLTITPQYTNQKSNITVGYTGITSPDLSYIQYRVRSYNDELGTAGGDIVSYSTATKVNTLSSGQFTLNSATFLSTGCVQIGVRGVDIAGGTGPERTILLHYDTTAPTMVEPSTGKSYITIKNNPNTSPTNCATSLPVLYWEWIYDIHFQEVQASVNNTSSYVKIGDYYEGECVLPSSLASKLVEGKNTIYIRGIDKAGNCSEPKALTYYYDVCAPTMLTYGLSPETTEEDKKNQAPEISYQFKDGNLEGNITLEYNINGGSFNTISNGVKSGVSGTYTIPKSKFINSGLYTIGLRAKDSAGNTTNVVPRDYYYKGDEEVIADNYQPKNVIVMERESGESIISWQEASLEDHVTYEIYRSTVSGFSIKNETPYLSGITKNSAVISSTTPGQIYYYKVRAVYSGTVKSYGKVSEQVSSISATSAERDANRGSSFFVQTDALDMPMGSAHTNLFTGSLYYEPSNLVINGQGLDVSMGIRYESSSQLNSLVGKGWNFSFVSYIMQQGNTLCYVDESGNKTSFTEKDGEYRCLQNSEQTIQKVNTTVKIAGFSHQEQNETTTLAVSYILKGKDDIKSYYNEFGDIVLKEEPNGDQILYVYEPNHNLLVRIEGKKAKGNAKPYGVIGYDEDLLKQGIVRVSKMAIMGAGEEADKNQELESLTFNYEGNRINKIIHNAGNQSLTYVYGYDTTTKNLTQLEDASGTLYQVNYDTNNRVTSWVKPSGEGSYYTYGSGNTEITKGYKGQNNNSLCSETYYFDSVGKVTKELDVNGNQTTYTYGTGDQSFLRLETTQTIAYQELVDGKVINKTKQIVNQSTYNDNLDVKKEVDENGTVTTYTYENTNENNTGESLPTEVKEVAADGSVLAHNEYEYDDKGNETLSVDKIDQTETITERESETKETTTQKEKGEEGSVTVTQKDGYGNEISETTKAGTVDVTNTTGYDDMGRVTLSESNGIRTQTGYDDMGRPVMTTEINIVSGTTKIETKQYDINGNVIKEVGFDGTVTTSMYDSSNRVISRSISRNGKTRTEATSYSYELVTTYAGNEPETIYASKTTVTTNGIITSIQYANEKGEVIRTYQDGIYTDYQYNKSGKAIVTYVMGTTVKSTGGKYTYQVYDAKGNLTATLREPVYDTEGIVSVKSSTVVASSTYDELGNKLTDTDALGLVTQYEYNENRKLIKVTSSDGNYNQYLDKEKIEENPADSKEVFTTKTNHANNTYSEVVENNAGQVLRQTDHGNNDEKISVRYEYDSEGNKSKQINEDGSYIKYDYNEKNIITNESTYNTNDKITSSTSYSYDDNDMVDKVVTYEYVGDVKIPLQTTLYEYDDAFHKLTKCIQVMGTNNPTDEEKEKGSISYQYDDKDRLIGVTYGGKTSGITSLIYHYDDKNWLTSIEGTLQGETVQLMSYRYDEFGKVEKITQNLDVLGDDDKQLIKEYDYDQFDRVTQMDYTVDTQRIEKYVYSYDKNSNILTKNEEKTKDEKTKTSLTTYTYDNNRLKTSTKSNPLSDESSLTSYSYDIVGNKVEEVCDGKTSSYTYNGLNQLTTVTGSALSISYTYDVNGNQKTVTQGNQVTTNTYDEKNQLKEIEKKVDGTTQLLCKNAYNYEGKRVRRTSNGTTTYYRYQNDMLLEKTDETGVSKAFYLYGANSNVQGFESSGQYYTYAKDIQSSVSSVVDRTGSVVLNYEYDDYGETTCSGNASLNNDLAYTSGVYDSDTEQYYLNARYYDPSVGSFLSQDTYRGDESNSGTWNLYGYCGGNPVNYVDPSGHNACLEWSATMWWLCSVDGPIPVGDAIYGLGIAVCAGVSVLGSNEVTLPQEKTIVKKEIKAITAPLAIEVNKALKKAKTKKKNNKTARHHMIAKAASGAEKARDIYLKAGFRINDKINLVTIKQSLHWFLHTSSYYGAVNVLMRKAKGNRPRIILTLGLIRAVLTKASVLAP